VPPRFDFSALPSAQRMLEEIFLRAPMGLLLCDRTGRCVLVNPMHTQMFGAVPPPDYNVFEDTVLQRSGMADLVRRAFTGERIAIPPLWYDARELTNVRVEQARRFALSAELVPLPAGDDGGEVSHVLFVLTDVTESHLARELAEDTAARSAFLADAGRLLSSSLDMEATLNGLARLATPTLADFCIVDLVERGGAVRRVAAVHADPAAQPVLDEMLGYPPVPGSPQPARRVLDTGAPELLEQVDPDVVAAHTLNAEHRALLLRLGVRSHLAVPLAGPSGIVGVISLGYAGERRYGAAELSLVQALADRAAIAIENARLYEDVARSEERFRLMADSVPQIVWITDGAGNVEFYNRQWMEYTGHQTPSSAENTVQSFLHPDDAERTLERFEQARAGGGTFLVEHRIRSAAGEYRWFLARGVPQRDPRTGAVLRWFGASTDIHDLKLAEGALREADRRKDEFLAMLAHELRNPLAAISNTAWLLKRKAAAPELAPYFDVLARQTGRLTHLVDDLLDVSRVTRGLIDLQLAPVDLVKVVERALESLQALIEERRHLLEFQRPAFPVQVSGDQARLEQVVVNLVTNAAKYTDRGGHIAIALEAGQDSAKLTVRDDGIGMAPEFLGRVFDLFAQAERGLARSQGGLGIGLTIVRRLVELHGGTITAASAGPGHGSTFTVRLPLAQGGAVAGNPPAPPAVAARRPRHILIVDDSVDGAETLALVLEGSGHRIGMAHTALAAQEIALAAPPEVVLLDIGLPDIDGYELARRLRAHPATRGCVLVALTGYGQASDRERALDAGFDLHLVKPVDIAELERWLDSLS
jgi:PAS domain S-box-containing protein